MAKVEAKTRPAEKPWRTFHAYEHEPCLEKSPPWRADCNTIVEVFVSPGRQPLTDAERAEMGVADEPGYYGNAIKAWEEELGAGNTQEAPR